MRQQLQACCRRLQLANSLFRKSADASALHAIVTEMPSDSEAQAQISEYLRMINLMIVRAKEGSASFCQCMPVACMRHHACQLPHLVWKSWPWPDLGFAGQLHSACRSRYAIEVERLFLIVMACICRCMVVLLRNVLPSQDSIIGHFMHMH